MAETTSENESVGFDSFHMEAKPQQGISKAPDFRFGRVLLQESATTWPDDAPLCEWLGIVCRVSTNIQRPDSAEERRARIADMVQQRGSIKLTDLVGPLGVSEPTLRKDLTALEKQGRLKRTHGGAVALEAPATTEPSAMAPEAPAVTALRGEQPSPTSAASPVAAPPASSLTTPAAQRTARERIARVCLGMIAGDSSAYFDSGATIATMATLMEGPANVLTNSVPIAPVLADKARIGHTLLGGQYQPLGECVTGPIAMMALSQFTVDTAFIDVVGLTAAGATVADVAEADLKRAAIDSARRVVLPLESRKIGATGFCHLVSLERIDDIVTDAPHSDLERWCAAAGVRLHVAV